MKLIKTWNQENLKTLVNTQNPLKTSLNNLIWSNPVVLELTLNLTKDWPSLIDFDKVSQDLISLFSQSDCLIIIVIYKHKYLTTFYQSNGQILDLHLVSWWTCVVVSTHWETLIKTRWHNLTIQNGWIYAIKANKWPKYP